MYFTEEMLAELATDHEALRAKYDEMYTGYLHRDYVSDRGREFGHHGLLRRIQSLKRCIDRVYELLPPERDEHPTDDARHNAELIIQAFVFNTFGTADNLAWIWVSEKNITRADGSPIPMSAVGIRKELVRRSFTVRFRTLLDERADWFTYLEGFRHGLAHRIPLYIPPYIVTHDNEGAYRVLEATKNDAARRGNLADYERLDGEQKALTAFRPWMQHSFIEEAQPIVFHSQMIADFNTLHEMAMMLLNDLAS